VRYRPIGLLFPGESDCNIDKQEFRPSNEIPGRSVVRLSVAIGTVHAFAAMVLLSSALFALSGPVRAQAGARLNLTGEWTGNFMGGSAFWLTQDGDRVTGKFNYGNGSGFARGSWRSGSLILILYPTDAQGGNSCEAKKLVVVGAKGAVSHLDVFVLDLGGGTGYQGGMTRTKPSAGPAVAYPYDAEWKNCRQLLTYELAFETSSDKLTGGDWPILQTMADLMKKDATVKVQVVGHSDNTGDPAANQALSERRAKTVMRVLAERYHVDPNRLAAKGYGSEQPLTGNDTEQGRAINRRVELIGQ